MITAAPSFPTTSLTAIVQAGQTEGPGHGASTPNPGLVALCEAYHRPVEAYLRRWLWDGEQAEDLCQAFFAKLIAERSFRSWNPKLSRFRSFLKLQLRRFVANEHRKEGMQKRGGHERPFSLHLLDEAPRAAVSEAALDEVFDREWARLVFRTAWERLAEEYAEAGLETQFRVLRDKMLSGTGPTFEELAPQFGLTVNGLKTAAARLRARFRAILREAMLQVVEHPWELDEEIRYLREVLTVVGTEKEP